MSTPKKMLAPIPGLTAADEKKAQSLSPFELKNQLISLAGDTQLNAGRGNPNFFNGLARLAMCTLTEFSVFIAERDKDNSHIRYTPRKPTSPGNEIYEALKIFCRDRPGEGTDFLIEAVDWALENETLGLESNDFLYELTDAARGDFYPGAPSQSTPPRILKNTQTIVNQYLKQVLLSENNTHTFDLFATEGATSAMVYLFNSLIENYILNKKDKVAVITPVFSPYLEIPALNDYEFDLVYIDASEKRGWQVSEPEMDKLRDTQIKALYLINPTNPTSVALDDKTLGYLKAVIEEDNKDLIVLVDAVYATFVDNFSSIINTIPENCITVYSFSKYFGVTGWRLGVIMLARQNIVDRKIQTIVNRNNRKRQALVQRYHIDSETPSALPLIDRICLDSREVALGHTAGIACPGQAMMTLFALYNLIYQPPYKKALKQLLVHRTGLLYEHLPSAKSENDNAQHTYYYALLDILEMAETKGEDFAVYLLKTFYPVDFVFQLAYQKSSVCLPGYGFFEKVASDENQITPTDRNNWSIRVSLANLPTPSYEALGQNIKEILDLYYDKFSKDRRAL